MRQPGTITQPTNTCSAQQVIHFSIQLAVPGATSYMGSYGTGWAVTAGGTHSATITIGTGVELLPLPQTNGCGNREALQQGI
jgi:hypothetical protein